MEHLVFDKAEREGKGMLKEDEDESRRNLGERFLTLSGARKWCKRYMAGKRCTVKILHYCSEKGECYSLRWTGYMLAPCRSGGSGRRW